VIVVDDGSTDDTAAVAGEFHFRVIKTPHDGLAAARNAGLEAATGQIVAYIDDDAWPDPTPAEVSRTHLQLRELRS
jgi:glycosyltransferase involved in cell wall biosynthesis